MPRDQLLMERAKGMRREPSPFEHKLWLSLRAGRLGGAKFRRQNVVGPYIVDFACRSPRMIVIEVDGDTHGSTIERDERRTQYLEGRGYATNLDAVLAAIEEALRLPLSPALSPEGERE